MHGRKQMSTRDLDIKLAVAAYVSGSIISQLHDYDRAVADVKEAAATALKQHLSLVPLAATVHSVDSSLAKQLIAAWATQFAVETPSSQSLWFPLRSYIEDCLLGTGWTIVPEGISDPNPCKPSEIYSDIHVTVRRIVTH